MTGLLLKDLLNLKRMTKQYVLILGAMCVWSVMMKNPSFISMYTVLCTAMMVPSSFTYDEYAQFDKYALTMPLTRRALVKEKYRLLLLLVGGGMALGTMISVFINCFIREDVLELVGTGVVMGSLFLLVYSIIIPLIYKWGAEKARMIMVMVYLGLFGAVYGVVWLVKRGSFSLWPAGLSEGQLMAVLVGGALAITLVALAVSYRVSMEIIKRKEY